MEPNQLEFLKGQIVAYDDAFDIVGNESSKCDDIREEIVEKIMKLLRKSGDFRKYLELAINSKDHILHELENTDDSD